MITEVTTATSLGRMARNRNGSTCMAGVAIQTMPRAVMRTMSRGVQLVTVMANPRTKFKNAGTPNKILGFRTLSAIIPPMSEPGMRP